MLLWPHEMKLDIINNIFVERKSDKDKKHALNHTSYTALINILHQIVFFTKEKSVAHRKLRYTDTNLHLVTASSVTAGV